MVGILTQSPAGREEPLLNCNGYVPAMKSFESRKRRACAVKNGYLKLDNKLNYGNPYSNS